MLVEAILGVSLLGRAADLLMKKRLITELSAESSTLRPLFALSLATADEATLLRMETTGVGYSPFKRAEQRLETHKKYFASKGCSGCGGFYPIVTPKELHVVLHDVLQGPILKRLFKRAGKIRAGSHRFCEVCGGPMKKNQDTCAW